MQAREEILNNLGKAIKKIRLEKGISQTQLAHSIGKDQQAIQRIEAGRYNPSIWYLYQIAEGLDVEIQRFLTTEED